MPCWYLEGSCLLNENQLPFLLFYLPQYGIHGLIQVIYGLVDFERICSINRCAGGHAWSGGVVPGPIKPEIRPGSSRQAAGELESCHGRAHIFTLAELHGCQGEIQPVVWTLWNPDTACSSVQRFAASYGTDVDRSSGGFYLDPIGFPLRSGHLACAV